MAATMAMPARRAALGELSESRFNYNVQCKPVKNGMLIYTYPLVFAFSSRRFLFQGLTQTSSRLCQSVGFLQFQGSVLDLQLLL